LSRRAPCISEHIIFIAPHPPQRLGDIDIELEELTGALLRVQTEEVLRGLGFKDSELSRSVAKLSGGWRMRIRLAAALLSKPDILLLDEPTNHLDLAGVVWLQEYITSHPQCPQTLVMVSHDESFLSVVATEVIIMKDKSLSYFSGSYDQLSLLLSYLIYSVAFAHLVSSHHIILQILATRRRGCQPALPSIGCPRSPGGRRPQSYCCDASFCARRQRRTKRQNTEASQAKARKNGSHRPVQGRRAALQAAVSGHLG
jgi:ABC-type multidrug transport system ATPase subunit